MTSEFKASARRFAALISAAALTAGSVFIPKALADTSVVTISSADDFISFLKSCTSDEFSRGRTFIIDNDIDMDGKKFSGGGIFCGTLMGNGHTIRNISMDFREANGGIFTNIGNDGQIRDLNISGTFHQYTNTGNTISSESIVGDIMKNAGISGISPTESTGITGAVAALNSGLIVNCSFEGEISGQQSTGGIVGSNTDSGIIDACTGAARVSGLERTGGIAGENDGVIKNSKNTGSVNPEAEETTKDTGGIAGYNKGIIKNSTNEGDAGCEGYGTNTGGIAGKQSGCILECKNSGYIGAKKNAGGITGIFIPYTDVDMVTDDLRSELEKQKQDLKNEADKLRGNLKKSVDDLTDSMGIFNGSLPFLSGGGDGLDNVLNSLSGYIDNANDRRAQSTDALSDLAGALEAAVNERNADTALRDELSGSLDAISASFTDVNDSLVRAIDETSALSADITALTNDLSDFLGTASNNMNQGSANRADITDSLTRAMDRMDFETDALDDAAQSLLNLSNTLDDVVNDLEDTSDDINSVILDPFRTLNREIKKIIRDFENHKITADELEKKLEEIKNKLGDTKEDIKNKLHPSSSPAPKSARAVINELLFTTAYAKDDSELLSLDEILDTERIKEEMKKVISVDVTLDRNIAGEYADNATIKNCINTGKVSCTDNAGGISGNMGVETLSRKGDVIRLPDGKTVVSDMAVKAVINSCINDGKIYAKNRFAGGIIGASNVGIIKNCLGAGEICAEEGGYAGGIGGGVNSSILFSVCAARISGKNDLGGIAGAGNVIRECYSIASFDTDAERIGMIAGSADGNVENNCFISEGIGGIGGASYRTNAEEIPFEEMKCTDKLPPRMDMFFNEDWVSETGCFPQIKALARSDAEVIGMDIKALCAKYANTIFTVNFIIDGKTVKTLSKNYNDKLSSDEIPSLTGADGRYPHWNRNTDEPIRRHTDFIAEYNDATTTIASDEEPPILLVEGNFSDNSSVTVSQAEITADFPGYSKVKAYSFKIEPKKDGEGGFRLHILSRDESTSAIGIMRNGEPEVIECGRDGSYLVCDMDSPHSFAVLAKDSGGAPVLIFIVCAAAVSALAAMAVIISRRGKKAAEKKQEDALDDILTEGTDKEITDTEKQEQAEDALDDILTEGSDKEIPDTEKQER